MAQKKKKKNHRRSGIAVAMVLRHPRCQRMTNRNKKRAKDAKNNWRRDWE